MDLFADLPEPTNACNDSTKQGNDDEHIEQECSNSKIKTKRKIELVDNEMGEKKQKLQSVYKLKGYYAERKGEREEMQDAHTIIDDFTTQLCQLKQQQEASTNKDVSDEINRISYFAVFDGHGGARASKYAAKHLHVNLASALSIDSLTKLECEIKPRLIETFKRTDAEFLKVAAASKPSWKDGSTAIVVLAINNTLYIANLGDSKAVLCRQCGDDSEDKPKYQGIPLSKDHSPTDYEERQRIQKAGGNVKEGRVMGVLEVSRSVGDGQFKKHGVICLPEVKKCELTGNDRYILIACDGLWKTFTTTEAIHYINRTLEEEDDTTRCQKMETACSKICAEAVKKCSGDNVTVLIVDIGEHHTTPITINWQNQ